MSGLAHHRALVTGAGKGIGRAIAERLAADGAKVCVQDLDADAAARVAEAIGGTAVGGDVANEGDVEAAFAHAERAFGAVTLLVSNAGIVTQGRLVDLSVADFDRMIAVHLRGTFLTCRRALPAMLAAGSGVIVNIASQLGQIGGVELTHYAAAKAGIVGLTKSLAREVSAEGVRVNAVAPGPIETDLVRDLSPAWRAAKAAELPLRRFGQTHEVAGTVAFLASDDGALYVGQTLGPNSGDVML